MTLCGIIDAKDKESAMSLLKKTPDLAEHRLDYMETPDYLKTDIPLIATCRPSFLGGKFDGPEERRFEILKGAIAHGYKYVDVELEADDALRKDLITFAREHDCKVIISTHDFKSTPEELELLLDAIVLAGADIAKIVTTPETDKDCKKLISLYPRSPIPLIAFCMGDIGRFTRVLGHYLGAPFTYVSLGEKTAPGQFSIGEMIEIREAIK